MSADLVAKGLRYLDPQERSAAPSGEHLPARHGVAGTAGRPASLSDQDSAPIGGVGRERQGYHSALRERCAIDHNHDTVYRC